MIVDPKRLFVGLINILILCYARIALQSPSSSGLYDL